MKFLLVLCATFVVACGAEQYTDKYDNVDLDQILKSDRLLKNYVNCLLDKGRCSPDGQELRSHIEDAIQTACEKCSEKQKDATKKVFHFLIKNKREWWNELEAKYDPSGSYKSKYHDQLKAEGIDI